MPAPQPQRLQVPADVSGVSPVPSQVWGGPSPVDISTAVRRGDRPPVAAETAPTGQARPGQARFIITRPKSGRRTRRQRSGKPETRIVAVCWIPRLLRISAWSSSQLTPPAADSIPFLTEAASELKTET